MTTQQELLAALRGRFGDSQTAIAEAMQISLSRLNNYVRGVRQMDDDAVVACCELLGWNAQKYVAKHRAELAKTTRERNFWRSVSTAATLLLFAVAPALNPAAAYTDDAQHAQAPTMHYAKWSLVLSFIRRMFRLGRGHPAASLLA